MNKYFWVFMLLSIAVLGQSTQQYSEKQLSLHQTNYRAQKHNLRTNDEIISMGKSTRGRGGGGLGFVGFILGPILFIISFIIIFQNERKASIDLRRLQLASSLVKQVNPFVQHQMYENDGQLIHITGNTQNNEMLTQRLTGISLRDAVKIQRKVQVKQFRAKNNDNQQEEYDLLWVTHHQSNAGSRTNDPNRWFVEEQITKAPHVFIGNYFLNDSQKDRLSADNQYQPTQDNAYQLLRSIGRQGQNPQIIGNYIYYPPYGGSIESPGAVRVYFNYCSVGPTSIIAKANKNTFQPYRIDIQDNGGQIDESSGPECGCCFLCSCMESCFAPITQIDLIKQQTLSYTQMIDSELKTRKTIRWAIRIASYFLMVISICIFFSPLTTLLGYIPLVGGFLKSAVGIAIFIAALIICIPLWLIVLTISWLIFHPKIGLIFLGVTIVITAIIIYLLSSQGSQSKGTTTAGIGFNMRHFLDMN